MSKKRFVYQKSLNDFSVTQPVEKPYLLPHNKTLMTFCEIHHEKHFSFWYFHNESLCESPFRIVYLYTAAIKEQDAIASVGVTC